MYEAQPGMARSVKSLIANTDAMPATVSSASPAEKAGLKKGDLITSIGGTSPKTLSDFYRQLWWLGSAGILVPLDVERDGKNEHFDVQSINRIDHLKLKSSL